MIRIFVFLLLLNMALPSFSAEIIIQAGELGTSSTGNWFKASSASMPYENNKGMYAVAGGPIETYTFAPILPETTSYRVEIFNSCYSPRSHQVIHNIHHASGTATHILEQDCQLDSFVGQWRALGTYVFNAGANGVLTIDTSGSDGRYIGATAVRFVYDLTNKPSNSSPIITPSLSEVEVIEGESVNLYASALDAEDGDISHSIQWRALNLTGEGGYFSIVAGTTDFVVEMKVEDSQGATSTEIISIIVTNIIDPPLNQGSIVYDFDCVELKPLQGFITNNEQALLNVGTRCGQYIAELTDNSNNKTLHFNNEQGRFDGLLATFPFSVIARNVGTASVGDSQKNHNTEDSSYHFVGLQVHHYNFENRDSVHLVVGQRGLTQNTIEGKMTSDGISNQNDIGGNILPDGRADIMLVGDRMGNIKAYWQLPNKSRNSDNDNWLPYKVTGDLPGVLPQWGGDKVYVGFITYAYGSDAAPFMGVADSLEVIN